MGWNISPQSRPGACVMLGPFREGFMKDCGLSRAFKVADISRWLKSIESPGPSQGLRVQECSIYRKFTEFGRRG